MGKNSGEKVMINYYGLTHKETYSHVYLSLKIIYILFTV